ncbi:MAG: ATP-binding protein [Bdellovibrionales bacterium]
MKKTKNLWMSWSSGKDSAFALSKLMRDSAYSVGALFTTINEKYGRVAMHSTRVELAKAQAAAIGLPIHFISLPDPCSNEQYEDRMRQFIEVARKAGVESFGFGDLFLQDIRQYREKQLAGTGFEPVFPLWGVDTRTLSAEMIANIGAVITCVDLAKLPATFAGRVYDDRFLNDLPPGIDPCGENGEFHTFVFKGPGWRHPLVWSLGETVTRGGFAYADILPAN